MCQGQCSGSPPRAEAELPCLALNLCLLMASCLFPHLSNGDNNSDHRTGREHSFNESIHVKSPELCLAESKLSVCVCVCVCAQLCLTLCSSMDCNQPGSSVLEFPRWEYWRGLPFPTPGYLPDPGIEPASPALAGGFFTTSATWEAQAIHA